MAAAKLDLEKVQCSRHPSNVEALLHFCDSNIRTYSKVMKESGFNTRFGNRTARPFNQLTSEDRTNLPFFSQQQRSKTSWQSVQIFLPHSLQP